MVKHYYSLLRVSILLFSFEKYRAHFDFQMIYMNTHTHLVVKIKLFLYRRLHCITITTGEFLLAIASHYFYYAKYYLYSIFTPGKHALRIAYNHIYCICCERWNFVSFVIQMNHTSVGSNAINYERNCCAAHFIL